MTYTVERIPPPETKLGPSLRQQVIRLKPGETFCAPDKTLGTLKVTVSHVKKYLHQDRRFTVRMTDDGPRVWRLS
jgi:hypothetical protein